MKMKKKSLWKQQKGWIACSNCRKLTLLISICVVNYCNNIIMNNIGTKTKKKNSHLYTKSLFDNKLIRHIIKF